MALFKFHPDDIFINTLEAYPEFSFYIHSGTVFIDSMPHREGTNADVGNGFVSLYELNNDKPTTQRIQPTMIKDASRETIRSISQQDFALKYNYDGEIITGSYDLSASIARDYFGLNSSARTRLNALRNSLDHYKFISPHYAFNSKHGNKSTQEASVISISSIFYGERIKKGSVLLEYFVSGSLIGRLQDIGYNGELIQTAPVGSTGSGSCAGVVLYKEGAVVLTGSWTLGDNSIDYVASTDTANKWTQFGDGLHKDVTQNLSALSASYFISYQGVTHTNTMMMMAHAKYAELNHSNNPTYKDYSHPNFGIAITSSNSYVELKVPPKNVVDTELTDVIPDFQKETYISKVAIYDDDKNLIGIAKVATPVRKTEDRQYIFKLKLDI